MAQYKRKLKNIKALIFDVDGVMTDSNLLLLPHGEGMIRTMNTRDGFALQLAVKKGFHIAAITGGNSSTVQSRLEYLGLKHIYLKSDNKTQVYEKFKIMAGISDEEILYMGDDIPDYFVMKKAAIACCPKDAAEEIIEIADYISPYKGGKGCVRDVVEQVLKIQNCWFDKHQDGA